MIYNPLAESALLGRVVGISPIIDPKMGRAK